MGAGWQSRRVLPSIIGIVVFWINVIVVNFSFLLLLLLSSAEWGQDDEVEEYRLQSTPTKLTMDKCWQGRRWIFGEGVRKKREIFGQAEDLPPPPPPNSYLCKKYSLHLTSYYYCIFWSGLVWSGDIDLFAAIFHVRGLTWSWDDLWGFNLKFDWCGRTDTERAKVV